MNKHLHTPGKSQQQTKEAQCGEPIGLLGLLTGVYIDNEILIGNWRIQRLTPLYMIGRHLKGLEVFISSAVLTSREGEALWNLVNVRDFLKLLSCLPLSLDAIPLEFPIKLLSQNGSFKCRVNCYRGPCRHKTTPGWHYTCDANIYTGPLCHIILPEQGLRETRREQVSVKQTHDCDNDNSPFMMEPSWLLCLLMVPLRIKD